jgi:Na+/melibiose symporter-like transporter
MLCPNCGTKTTNDHKFCRNCGMNLGPVSQAVAAHLSGGGATAAAAAAERAAARRARRGMAKGLFVGVIVFMLGMLMGFLPGAPFKAVGAMITLISVVFSLVVVLSTLRRSAAEEDAAPAPPHLPEAAPGTGRLLHEGRIRPASSVTDHTTELLGVEVKERKPRA